MNVQSRIVSVAVFGLLLAVAPLFICGSAQAYYNERFSMTFGLINFQGASQTDFTVGLEYEHRFDPFFGFGALGNYVLSTPPATVLGAPEVFVHPLSGDWLISCSPIFEFGADIGAHLGVRVGTRLPIPLDFITIVPSFAVDFIDQERDYVFGLGFEI